MDSLPIEITEIIFIIINPKDYTNFILSYDVALCFWRNKKIREKYKEQYLRVIRKDFTNDPETYVIKTIRVDNGKNHGKYTEYYENGQIWIDTTYQNDQKHGKYTEYHKNGQIWIDTTYQNDQKHGKYTCYHNGQILIDTTYQNGQKHGKYTEYHKNGQIWIDTTYQNDQKYGKYICYHNGQIWIDIMC
jgi:antitoxin component YwqK of YwqJK toxin-antitoxin module